MLLILTIGHKNKDHRSIYFDNLNILRIEESLLLRKLYKMKLRTIFIQRSWLQPLTVPVNFDSKQFTFFLLQMIMTNHHP